MESKEKHLKRYYDRRLFAIKYLGGRCKKCGCDNNLQFDHIDINKKKYAIGKILMYNINTLKDELDKCQLLCKSCHKGKCKIDGSFYKNTPIGSNVYGSKLKESDVYKIKKMLKIKTPTEISKIFKVSRETISGIKCGRTWKHIA